MQHSARLRLSGVSDETIEDYINFEQSENVSEKDKAVLRIALKSTTSPADTTDDDIRALKDFGYSDADIIEILLVANFHSVLARTNVTLGI